jgi:hypothetical protein
MIPSTISPVTSNSRLEKFFAKVSSARGRIIFALDATASRQPSWDLASKLTSQMFESVAAIGGLDVQLVYYRGADECVASRWLNDARSLTSIMSGIMCKSGHTKIVRVLSHTGREHRRQPVNALILISDACEESPLDLYAKARDLGVAIFAFQEGDDASVTHVYSELARLTGGATAAFNAGAAQRLADLLRAVAVYATGGIGALLTQKSDAAKLLLAQLKK